MVVVQRPWRMVGRTHGRSEKTGKLFSWVWGEMGMINGMKVLLARHKNGGLICKKQ